MSLPNGITSDTSGYLYVTAYFTDKIFKINISDSSYITLVNSELDSPNGIEFDFTNNRLLVMNEGMPNAPIIAIDKNTGTISTLVETNISQTDGLTIDNKGNTYISSWATGKVYRYDTTFTKPPEVFSSGHSGPADIFYDELNNLIAVPNFNSNSVDFIPITISGQKENIQNKINNITLFPNPFTYNIHFEFYLPENVLTKIFVYDILGNRIAELVNEELNKGDYSISWNGKDKNDNETTQGIYFVFFNIEDHFRTFKTIKH